MYSKIFTKSSFKISVSSLPFSTIPFIVFRTIGDLSCWIVHFKDSTPSAKNECSINLAAALLTRGFSSDKRKFSINSKILSSFLSILLKASIELLRISGSSLDSINENNNSIANALLSKLFSRSSQIFSGDNDPCIFNGNFHFNYYFIY